MSEVAPTYGGGAKTTIAQANAIAQDATNNIHEIGWAVKHLRHGLCVTRDGWNGKGQYLGLQNPDAHSVNMLPYVYIITVDGKRVPWLCSQTDLLATDWRLA